MRKQIEPNLKELLDNRYLSSKYYMALDKIESKFFNKFKRYEKIKN